jgi:Kef-type K+ transport system membrane component KefB
MDAPGGTRRTNRLRTVLRAMVLGAFFSDVAVIVLLIGVVVFSVAGLSFDPHGYGTIFGSVLAVVLVPVAQMLWVLYRWLRRGG